MLMLLDIDAGDPNDDEHGEPFNDDMEDWIAG